MRKLFLSLAAAAVTMTAAALMPSNASAAVLAPSAMKSAAVKTSMVGNVRWFRVCHHHWRHGDHCRPVWRPGYFGHHHHHHYRHYR